MGVLNVRDGYRLWAPNYADENAITHLEDRLAGAMTPPLAGLRLLDAGCGTGRRLCGTDAASAVGVDISPEMLAAGIGEGVPEAGIRTIIGDVRRLPLPDRAFDMIWCRLVIGHLPECEGVYAELARVADQGALLVATDFHPAAYTAGHRRTFRDGVGTIHEVEHYVHTPAAHLAAARAAGLEGVAVREAKIGPEVRCYYESAGRDALYEAHIGLPVVLALAFRRGR